ncbi:DUF6174 domain-containing protein [Streptomyces sp. NPDC055013]
MTAVSRPTRAVFSASLIGGLLCAVVACGAETAKSTSAHSRTTWQEPAAYTYTLRSGEGERTLIGTFRITVRDGAVVKAVGLDDSGRRVAQDIPDAVPTMGELLEELEQARRDDADVAEAEYAADGHPVRISLDWGKNTVDDEALYVISAYRPIGDQGDGRSY